MKSLFASALVCYLVCCSSAAAAPSYLLKADPKPGSTSHVKVQLEVGGERLMPSDTEVKKQPLKVVAEFDYREELVAWSADPKTANRSIRKYEQATAQIHVDNEIDERSLPENRRILLAEIRDCQSHIAAVEGTLTREQLDLVNIEASPLVLDRLLPQREMKEGESWSHKDDVIGALMCMDRVGVCDVSSVVTEESERQVQIRMAGTVHGTIDGATAEIELRAAYLYHLDLKRITRFNIAIKQLQKQTDIVPGLDVVAKALITIDPKKTPLDVPEKVRKIASQTKTPLSQTLAYESPTGKFRFEYDSAWFIRGEERDLLSFRHLKDYELEAHCSVSVLPARSTGRHTPLKEFERDVREVLGEKLESVSAATEWETKRGNHCLGVIAEGKVGELPIQWRNYLVSADDRPRLSLSVTLEKERSEKFADAERQIVDSVELIPTAVPATASTSDTLPR